MMQEDMAQALFDVGLAQDLFHFTGNIDRCATPGLNADHLLRHHVVILSPLAGFAVTSIFRVAGSCGLIGGGGLVLNQWTPAAAGLSAVMMT